MFIKNAVIFRVHSDAPSIEEMERAISALRSTPIGPYDAKSTGWVAPAGRKSAQLVHSMGGFRLLMAATQSKILPSSVIKEVVADLCTEFEKENGKPPTRRECIDIKERAIESMLPDAFVKVDRTAVWWDVNGGLIVIDSSSSKKAEEAINLLRCSLGSLKVTPLAVKKPVSQVMTTWISYANYRPSRLIVREKIVMQGRDGGVISAREVDVDGVEIQNIIGEGGSVSQVALTIEGVISFTLKEDLSLKAIEFSDALIDEANEQIEDGDEIVRTNTELLLMSGALRSVINTMVEWLGGEQSAAEVVSHEHR